MMEVTAALATLLQHVRFFDVEGTRWEPVHRITLRPRGGMVPNITEQASAPAARPYPALPSVPGTAHTC
jgi:hypothetical protein